MFIQLTHDKTADSVAGVVELSDEEMHDLKDEIHKSTSKGEIFYCKMELIRVPHP